VAKLSIGQAWSETGSFLARESRLILPIALLLLVIPGIVVELFRTQPGVEPEVGESLLQLVMMLASLVLGLIAVLAITHLAISPGASVGEALQAGRRRFLPLFLSTLLLGLAFAAVGILILSLTGGDAIASGAQIDPANLPPGLALGFFILSVTAILFWVRFMLATPVAAAEPAGAIAIIRRSWRLTGPHYWKLLGTFFLLLLVSSIAIFALTRMFGILAALAIGFPSWGSPSWLVIQVVSILLQSVFTVLLVVLAARIYLQLRGPDGPERFA